MTRSFGLTCMATLAVILQSLVANSLTLNESINLDNSLVSPNGKNNQDKNIQSVDSDSNSFKESVKAGYHVDAPTVAHWMNPDDNYVQNSAGESHIQNPAVKFPISGIVAVNFLFTQQKKSLENPKLNGKIFTETGKYLLREQKRNVDRIKYSYKIRTTDGEKFSRVIRHKINRMPNISRKRYQETQNDPKISANKFVRKFECSLDCISKRDLNRNKRETVADSQTRKGVRVRVSSIEQVPKVYKQNHDNKLWDTFSDAGFFRTARHRLDRMPLTFGKREEATDIYLRNEKVNPLFRSQRDRLSRMPATFGKRNTDGHSKDRYVEGIDFNVLDSYLNSQSEELDRAPEYNSEKETFNDDSFIRTARGSLSRMPLAFGKRAVTADSTYYKRALTNRLYRTPAIFGYTQNSDEEDDSFISERTTLRPTVFENISILKDKFKKPGDFQLPESLPFTRYQRSKLGRMPLAFGKRYFASTVINNDDDIFHTVKKRSRLDRMPITFGKRSV